MQKTDKLIKGVGVLLFLAMLAYLGYYAWNSLTNNVRTALAVNTTVTISTPVSGLIVREESTLTSEEPNLYITAEEGLMLASGETVAISYSDEAALERAGRIRELELEISRVETALYGATSEDIAIQAEAVQEAIISLSSAVARHELSELDVRCLGLGSLIFGDGAENATLEQLNALKLELSGLLTNSTTDTEDIKTDRAGVFTSVVDGWEQLTVEDVKNITPAALHDLEQAEPSVPKAAYGKLVTDFVWYYAAAVGQEHIVGLKPGDRVDLTFGRSVRGSIEARVLNIGPADENGSCVVVFSCSTALTDTLVLRKAQAEAVFSEYSGIRVPTEAIHTDEDGSLYVYVLTGLQAEKKSITLVYEDREFCLAAIEPEADALREGNEIIVSAHDLYDGKVMN